MSDNINGRVAIIDSVRTPFTRVGGAQSHLTALALGGIAAGDIVSRHHVSDLAADRVHFTWGSVMAYPGEVYGGRQIALQLGLTGVDGSAAEYACATGIRTTADAVRMIRLDEVDAVIAGGSESLSHRPLFVSDELDRLGRIPARSRDDSAVTAELRSMSMADLLPVQGAISEPYSGETLATYADTMMKEWSVSRDDADLFAVESHRRASAAAHHLASRMVATEGVPAVDEFVRPSTAIDQLRKLRPVNPALGGVTAGNASGLTDGAAATLFASEKVAEERGWSPVGYVRSVVLGAHDPSIGVLMGPALTMPIALKRAGLDWSDIDVIDIHEAFAGQVLANLAALSSRNFMQSRSIGGSWARTLSGDDINQWGGSLSIGHPFAATGSRLIGQVLDQLDLRGGRFGILGLCVGGARGAAMVIERA